MTAPDIKNGDKVAYLLLLTAAPTAHPADMVIDAVYRVETDEELQQYVDASTEVNEWALSNSFALLANAYERYVDTYSQIARAFTNTPSPKPQEAKLALNAVFISFLCMVRFYLDSTETRLKRLSSVSAAAELAQFEEAQQKEYNGIFAYRFAYKLRNYAQHCGLPITNLNASGKLNKQTGEAEYKFNAYFDRDALLRNFDWKKIRKDLAAQPEEIPVNQIASELIECLKRIEAAAMKAYVPRLEKAADTLDKLLEKTGGRAGTPYLGTFPKKDEGEIRISNVSLRPIPTELLVLVQTLKQSQK